jgi:hypothetical protein
MLADGAGGWEGSQFERHGIIYLFCNVFKPLVIHFALLLPPKNIECRTVGKYHHEKYGYLLLPV